MALLDNIEITLHRSGMGEEQARAAKAIEEAIRSAIDNAIGHAILDTQALRVAVAIIPREKVGS